MKMKFYSILALAGAALVGFANAQGTAVTDPVGYYEFDGQAGSNLFVPGFVNKKAFSGALTGVTAASSTLSVAGGLGVGTLDAGADPVAYVEITESGSAAEGVILDIVSHTDTDIVVDASEAELLALGLSGTEAVTIREHVTIKSAFASAEASLSAFAESVTYFEGASSTNYLWTGTVWSSDFGTTADGDTRPIYPGAGLIVNLIGPKSLTVVGEVKFGPTVVSAAAGGAINIIGPVNPLVGDGVAIQDAGFAGSFQLFADSLALYEQGTLSNTGTFLFDGTNMIDGNFVATTESIPNTVGGVVTVVADTGIKLSSGL